ncbi:uroporphyrinogen-III synthase [Pseudoxanthomonas sp. SGNA-20]|uniref:uroporphyrinogen-III synthase n=1 Tax=unclassified Pseudoxanthomonas TaxID=2645906 RepID=UPI00040E3691|nr:MULTISPECIES: uroporphyrinogen-III synthase [unclassified Pseudoxanthomonas]RRN59287.1 uroporphyrinogen-III synthase [Pseudoxanthomonas sp. SGNA-20]
MPAPPPPWTLVSLRPAGGHDAMRRAAARHGARLLALSPWALRPCDDDDARRALDAALACEAVLFTSPAAVRAAAALRPLRPGPGQAWLAVGAGSAAALRRAGVARAQAPARMDSEGVLALPALAAPASVGLVTAPGGRGMIAPTLEGRGARVLRADVYRREPLPPAPRALAALRALQGPACVAVSSGEALERVLDGWPEDAVAVLRRCAVAAASERLAELARARGFARVASAASPRPAALAALAQQLVAG